jgi:hypothetical protein
MRVKINYNNDELYCLYSKERIQIGEKYIEVKEKDSEGTYIKTYKLENYPVEDEEDFDNE